MASSADVRAALVDTLRRDLVGPGPEDADLAEELLPERPSRWYLTGYLVPANAPQDQRTSLAGPEDDLDDAGAADGLDDDADPDPASARRAFLPSSIGLSVLVDAATTRLEAEVSWGDYRREAPPDASATGRSDDTRAGAPAPPRPDAASFASDAPPPRHADDAFVPNGPAAPDASATAADANAAPPDAAAPDAPGPTEGAATVPPPDPGSGDAVSAPPADADEDAALSRHHPWRRAPRRATAVLDLSAPRAEVELPGTGGLRLSTLVRPVELDTPDGRRPVKAVSVFLVNHRPAASDARRADERFAFQARLSLTSDDGFVPRPDPRGFASDDWDERVGDLHYRDAHELAIGHNVAADWDAAPCRRVWSTWMPLAAVPRVVPAPLDGEPTVELGMERLGVVKDAADARACLDGLVARYRAWIDGQRQDLAGLAPRRAEVARALLDRAGAASNRIADGIAALDDPAVLEAFRTANRAVAAAARRRVAQEGGKRPADVDPPRWRPFQLAFILLNVVGLATPTHVDRAIVDLLFFPTGGGKTEAYLGLAAFAIALRRGRRPGLTGAGLCVLMRYSLRLLTLDQLARAAAVVCALELERLAAPEKLGTWPIEIGLWVGRAATPNRLGRAGDGDETTARSRVLRFANNTNAPQPLPLDRCPWCGTAFESHSFQLRPDANRPTRLDLHCANRGCEFHAARGRPLPIQAVDEPIYRRLPAFMIATLDKFAGLPWIGETASFFGGADRHDADGFYGPAEPGRGAPLAAPLAPPDLVIQDELHLVSGPLGTMAGLYESAIDALSARAVDGKDVRPKIVASTATVRQAEQQIGALFGRRHVAIFPPPGPDRRDSFFALAKPADEPAARHYLGIAAPGGSPKVVFLRALVAVMAAAQRQWERELLQRPNPVDPYMTAVAYFNALRELGGARRIVEGEVVQRLENIGRRRRLGSDYAPFTNRQIQYEPVELTSRVSTAEVARAKSRLACAFDETKDRVDVALATNMISVGLDIVRLGLMVVAGQPKSTAEYIQATSRVGRDADRPGLVVTLLNVNRPRDRSHYERFRTSHETFYRSVEATSVTPFAPRALDRGLAPVTVALARLGDPELTPETGAQAIVHARAALERYADELAARAAAHDRELAPDEVALLRTTVRGRVESLLDDWAKLAKEVGEGGGRLVYEGGHGAGRKLLRDVLDPELPTLPPAARRFRAPRSLRGVEPAVLVSVQTPQGQPLEVEEDAETAPDA